MAKKTPMSRKIAQYIATNPKAKAAEIAKELNTSVSYVYTVVHKLKRIASKKAPTNTTITMKAIAERFRLATEEGKRKLQEPLIRMDDAWQPPSLATVPDPVNHPAHYKVGGVETIDFIEAKGLNYNLGNVVKYITRAGHKSDLVEDLKKARWYLNREISKYATTSN